MKKFLILVILMALPPVVSAQALKCDSKDAVQLNKMSRKALMEAYCRADTVMAGAASGNMIGDERAADIQRRCLDEKQRTADTLKRRFGVEAPSCSPLIEERKK